MKRDKRTYIFYESWRDALKVFPSDVRLEVREAIDTYVFDDDMLELSPVAQGLFALIKGKLDEDIDKFNDSCEKQRKRIQEYWDKKKNTTEYHGIPRNTTATENENENEILVSNDTRIKKESIKKKRKIFVPPTLNDIVAYAALKELHDYAEDFFFYYESNGWMVGRNKMKDWHSAYCRWCRNQNTKTYGTNKNDTSAEQRRIDIATSIARDISSCHSI